MSEILPAIHLHNHAVSDLLRERLGLLESLFHDLDIDLLHIDLPTEFRRELGLLEQLLIDCGRHGGVCPMARTRAQLERRLVVKTRL